MALDVAIGLLRQQGDREFLSVTNTAMKVLQNILCSPDEPKYRSISSRCKVRRRVRAFGCSMV